MTKTKIIIGEILNEKNIKSNIWSAITNFFIVLLIVLNAVQIILEVDPDYSEYNTLFRIIDSVSIGVFSIEYILRFWTSSSIDIRYKGFVGKLRYLFSFYALIDLLAILPYYISILLFGPSLSEFRIVRVIRILRLARFMKSFDIIVKAIRSKRSELFISLQIVLVLTFVLSVLLYHVENKAQPDNFSTMWAAMLWSFSKFIGDIGGYGDFSPITASGMLLATGVGILSIAIFAVPAGIIASGFVEEIESEKKLKEINERVEMIESSFGATRSAHLNIKVPKRKRTLPELQSRLNYTDNEIFEAVRNSNKLRIKWEKSDPTLNIADMIVLEHFLSNTTYGLKRLNETSKIFIINPIGKGERGISHFSNTLSQYGEFNLISNEIFSGGEIRPENKFRLDINPIFSQETFEAIDGVKDFTNDIKNNINKEDWVFVFRTSAGRREYDLHILYGGIKGDVNYEDVKVPTINERTKLESFIQDVKLRIGLPIEKICTHEQFRNESPNLLHQFIRKKTGANVITIFISIDLISALDHIYFPFLKNLTESIKTLK